MPIDPRIALGVQPVQIPLPDPNSGLNALAKALQIKDLQSNSELNALKIDEYKRKIEDDKALRESLAASGADPYKVLLQRGRVTDAGAFLKSQNEAEKAKREAIKTDLEIGVKRAEHISSILTNARDPQSYGVVRNVIKGQFGVDMPEQFDPAYVQARIAEGQTITQRLAAEHQRLTLAETSRHNRVTEAETGRHNRTSEGIQGGQLAETRRHNTTMEGFRGQEVTGQNTGRMQKGVMDLRKEFNDLPEVKNFKEVLPIVTSAQRAPDTPAGDIDLIYAVGKVMDPGSVVREGEMNLVIKSGSPAQRLQGYANYVQGGGRLTPGQRQELVTIMRSRMEGLKSNYDSARKTYERHADQAQLPRDQIFIDNDVPAAPPVDFGTLPAGKPKPSGRGNAPTGAPKVVDFGSLR